MKLLYGENWGQTVSNAEIFSLISLIQEEIKKNKIKLIN